ncbi:MAG: outer membrane lipoprotein carrier protein LolA [Gemmatimonadaceae bacterium]
MHVRRLQSLILAGALLAPLSFASARPRAQGDLLDRAAALWSKARTARATFEQTITNSLTGGTLTATGEYQQQKPGKLSVSFSKPANERIVADGKYLWLYLPSTTPGQVIRTSMTEGSSGMMDPTQFLNSPRARFIVVPAGTLAIGGRPTHAFTLTPKSKAGAPFQTATVWIDDADATVRQFDVAENTGVQRKVRLTSFKTNVAVDAGAFTFEVPAGARVVNH